MTIGRYTVGVVLVLVLGIGVWAMRPVDPVAVAVTTAPARTAAVSGPVALSNLAAPSFDVVRVSPSGTAVLAGRAAPGAEVTVRDGADTVGRSVADDRGEWVIVPEAPIAAGGRALSLDARDATGVVHAATETVVVIVPGRDPAGPPAHPVPVMAVVLPEQGPSRIVQGATQALGLRTIDYDQQGELRFAGSAGPGATLRAYVDNEPAGDAVADAFGVWAVQPPPGMAAGVHILRIDQVAGQHVLSRVETSFQRDAAQATGTAISGRVVVQPGQNLWRLARSAYGEGMRYTVIYTANQGQIRDPNLIYPGQTFAVP